MSTVLPVGNRLPVRVPPGSRKSSWTFAPVPETPGILKSPTTSESPSLRGTFETINFPEFVL